MSFDFKDTKFLRSDSDKKMSGRVNPVNGQETSSLSIAKSVSDQGGSQNTSPNVHRRKKPIK